MRIYVDMDDVLCDYMGAHAAKREQNPDQLYPQSKAGFYLELEPIKGALDAMKWLHGTDKFQVFILTAPSIYNPHSYTEKRLWTEKHLGFDWCSKLILSPNKSLFRGDILIDDCDNGHGQDKFEGNLIQFGSPNFPNWKKIIDWLKE